MYYLHFINGKMWMFFGIMKWAEIAEMLETWWRWNPKLPYQCLGGFLKWLGGWILTWVWVVAFRNVFTAENWKLFVGFLWWIHLTPKPKNYHLVIQHSHGKSPFLIGKPSINGPFSMAMLNNQRVSAWLQSIQFLQSPKFWLREYPDELWENLVIYGDDIDDTQTFAPKVSCGWEHGHFKRWPVDGMGWPILWHRNQWVLSLSVYNPPLSLYPVKYMYILCSYIYIYQLHHISFLWSV